MRNFIVTAVLALSACGPSPFDEARYPAAARLPIARPAEAPDIPPLFEGAAELDVQSLVEAVLRRNPTLEAIERARRAAMARIAQARALDDPMLSYAVAPESLTDRGMRDGHEVELSQHLPWPGKLKLRGRAAEHEAHAAAHDLQTARQRLMQETRRAFYEYYFVHRALEINEVNLDLLEEFERIAGSKYAAGTVPRHDALQARVELLHLEHDAIMLSRMQRVARAVINTLLHRPTDAHLPPPPASVAPPYPRPQLQTLRERAINGRSELQALARRLEAARDQRRLAAREYYPDFTVMGAYNSMWDDPEHRWMLGAGINLPIQIGRRRAAEAEALSESQRIAAELIAGVDQVSFEVTDAYEQVAENEHIIHLYENDFLPVARENLQSARAGYETGEADFLTFLTAERDLRTTELNYQQALSDYHQRWADLQRAVGGEIHEENQP